MKGKKIGKKIVASVLTLAIICSNISIAAEHHADEIQAEVQEEIEPQAEETSAEENVSEAAEQVDGEETVSTEETETPAEDTPVDEPDTSGEVSDGEPSEEPAENPDVSGETGTDTNTEDTSNTEEDGEHKADDADQTVQNPANEMPSEDDSSNEEEPSDATQQPPQTTPSEENNGDTQTETPSEQPAPSETPEVTLPANTEAEPQEPTEAVEEIEETSEEAEEVEEEIDYEGLLTLEELTALDDETVEATMWESSAPSGMRRARARSISGDAWSFDAYYVNQDDRYDVTKTSDFNLKYQMEFHASQDLEPGTVQIRINRSLFSNRNNAEVTPSDIAVPQGKPGEYTTNRNTPFNYYEDGEYLVFFNYRKIPSGSNAAWQVLYKNLRLMEIKDESTWTLTPQISVGEKDPSNEDYESIQPLTGKVDSSVSITSVLKSPYQDTKLNYTPGLYTVAQIEKYIKGPLPEQYKDENGRLKTSEYRFIVWDVKVRGNATQPWNLFIEENPSVQLEDGRKIDGEVVGYKDNSSRSSGYGLAIKEPVLGTAGVDETASSTDQRESSWGSRFYVVTAYPAAQVEEDTIVQNDLTIRLDPVDDKDEDVSLAASTANWKYENYDWTYSGNMIGIEKETDDTLYTGWLDAYRGAKLAGEDYGALPFTTNGHMNGYAETHEITGDRLGEYIEGTYYTMTTADDVVYLHQKSDEAGVMMDREDYYFSSVTIEQADYGYDVWEDQLVDSELAKIKEEGKLPENFDSSVRIYAMFGGEGEELGWQLVDDTVELDETGHMKPYIFDETTIARQPWRVKVEHNSIDYRSTCRIDVNVCLKADSPRMKAILDARPASKNQASPIVRIENLSGTMAQAYNEAGPGKTYVDDESHYQNYEGLQNTTKGLYDNNLLVRDNAYRDMTWLVMTADSFKEAKSTNDVDNNRGLVEYMLTAYDGYEIYDKSCLDYLSEKDQDLISPGRNHVVFYDLLPYGMNFDASYPVTAGRITNLDSNGNYRKQYKSWDTTQVSVTVDPEEIVTDYRGTGRTLLVFRISFEGADATSYTAQKWIEGWGVDFRAYYDWKDMDAINQQAINSNISAFMPDFSDRAGGSNDTHPALCGLVSEVYLDNGEIESGTALAEACADLIREYNGVKGNIDGINLTIGEGDDAKACDSTYRNVLYANNILNDDIAVSSSSGIEKLVRADSDRLGTFSESTTVPTGTTYSYSIAVSTSASEARNIVIYDRLEHAAVDRKDIEGEPFAPFEENTWQGVFRSVDISALEKQGIYSTVYYNTDRGAAITSEEELPTDVLTAENGWYTEEAFQTAVSNQIAADKEKDGKEHTWTEYVKAIAVDLGEYRLPQNHSVSFQIKMQAPTLADLPEEHGNYAYNNASFYSVPVYYSWDMMGGTTEQIQPGSTVTGNSVRVGLAEMETLEILKRVSGDVPSARADESFEFQVYETYSFQGQPSKHPLAFTEYTLYKADGEGGWTAQEGQVYSTNGNGYLYLKHDEKAVFHLADVSRIQVQETENVFWESTVRTDVDTKGVKTLTFTNTFRPVLYVQKNLSAVPDSVTLTENDKTFTFKLETKKSDGSYQPAADAEFWYVDSARLDGSIPNKLGSGKTAADGTFKLVQGEIIALFPGITGTEYRLTEVEGEENWNWICTYKEMTGTLASNGTSKIFTNYYKWKDLHLTKEITHQSQEAYDAQDEELKVFTFRVLETLTNQDGTPMLDADGNPITKKKPAEEGSETSQIESTAGLEWVLLDANGKEIGTVENGTKGTLASDGSFSYALGFHTVKIKGLEADKTYLVTEVTDQLPSAPESNKPLYQAVNDTVEIKMPIYSSKKDAEFTNDYQRRSLSVSKTLVADQSSSDTDGAEEMGGAMTLMSGDLGSSEEASEIRDIDMSGGMGGEETEEEISFTFYLKINGKAKEGYPYTVTKQGIEIRRGTTGADGSFTLSDKETAVFEAVGMLGDSFEVREEPDENYPQIYPTKGESHTGTLSGDGVEVSFVNGSEGYLYISKEYTADSDLWSGNFVNSLKNAVENSTIKSKDNKDLEEDEGVKPPEIIANSPAAETLLEDSAVRFFLEVKVGNESYRWPQVDTPVRYINQLTGEEFSAMWKAENLSAVDEEDRSDGSIKMYPWYMIALPIGNGENDIPASATYILREAEEDQHRIIEIDSDTNIDKVMLQLSQSYPQKDQALTGTVEENPIATIYNEANRINPNGSSVCKQMTDASSEVPTGAKLVWRVEQHIGDAYTGSWIPAEGISYVVCERETGKPVSDRIETTKEDGKIILQKTDGGYPEVRFIQDQVYLNLYNARDIARLLGTTGGGGFMPMNDHTLTERALIPGGILNPGGSEMPDAPLLRVVEVMEESDAEWGTLAGYVDSMAMDGDKGYGLDVSYQNAMGFVNANRMAPIEIEKRMTAQSDQQFTMILKQVVSTNTDSNNGYFGKANIVKSEPRANIPYTIHNADGSIAGEAVTGVNGEIKLYAGQYASLSLPEESMWTVEEDLLSTPTYSLKDLAPKPGNSKMTWLDDNLMLINLPASVVRRTLTYDANGGTGAPASETTFVEVGKTVQFKVSSTKPTREGYEFIGWSVNDPTVMNEDQLWQAGEIAPWNTDITFYAIWRPDAPKRDGLSGLLGKFVKVNCVDDLHEFKTYSTIGLWNDAEVGAVTYANGTWVCNVTLYGNTYVNFYGLVEPIGTGVEHTLAPNEDATKTITLKWNGSSWTSGEPKNTLLATFNVVCQTYTVTYTDGVEDKVVFPDQSYEELRTGNSTPTFVGTPIREGYTFMGWAPGVNEVISADDAEDGVITYTATWQ